MQGPIPPRPEAKEVIAPTLATVYGAITVLIGRVTELEKTVSEKPAAPPVLTFSRSLTPTPSELLDTPPSSGPKSIPARASGVAKATARNPIIRFVVVATTLGFPWILQIVDWLKGANVGPIVRGLRLVADFLEGIGST